MKILITGGAGFIGSHASKKLSELGHEIVIVDNFNDYYDPQLKRARINEFLKDIPKKVYEIDIRDFEALKKVFVENKIDKVLHLAAQAGVLYAKENPFIYIQTNVEGTLNLLELIKDFQIKQFVYASSSSVYGGNAKIPFNENDQTKLPLSVYATSKIATENLAYTYHHIYKLPCTGLRFFTVYGPWDRPDMALFNFTKKILTNQPIEIRGYGKLKRNFTYIDDIIDGLVKSLEKIYPFEIFNLGGNGSIDLETYVNLIEKYLAKKAIKNYTEMQIGEMEVTFADTNKATKLLEFNPKTTIAEGIKKYVTWFLNYYKEIVPKK